MLHQKNKADKDSIYMFALIALLSVSLTLLVLVCMRASLIRKALTLDQDAYTPSDFCLMGINMSFDEYTPEKIEEEIKAYLSEKYQIDEIVYINPTY